MSTSATKEPEDRHPPHAVLHPFGDPLAYGEGIFLESWADVDSMQHLIVVLDDLPFMDSDALGSLVSGMRRFRGGDAKLIIVTANNALARLLSKTGAPTTQTYAAALDALREQ